ncbi:MAG: hypothetical protein A2504_03280 [Bdellovibrionales bacterium RIFOXYD12_FULL_39_22]|nr:MAG: hypothetical protein A2385_15690 [Bdellovibrionales bacterium RIFOXYB1_FULL_39_21]OFZ41586.1 MAG: hypothetical protein A2485_02380 [Bdellovibrionales bacterium RIFOXYC12_FULL_39_17]OFZ45899.1 MAG: hypothetical protein A2404_12745 [Bdellovibrionales bacterium RIFOXYC1_FULL_39_130]OFZ74830.1 MAG: hypothetical protein A2560_10175 [Bdellovibrionales bacterium RIFOXYD1_FULL_39_84]OFZ92691.1 MAG: hypothetical protein A2504_03280 [Bdellovibrionales bacterium RIFOXYD12_FULL_39_22]
MHKIAIVGGCGHIGLPLGIVLAENKFKTFLYDIDEASVNTVNDSILPHMEEEGEERLKEVIKSKYLLATISPKVLSDCDIVILTIGTPVDEHLNPRTADVFKVIDAILPYIKADQVLIFRSTLFPGTMSLINDYLKTKKCNASLAFCPERIVQGKGLIELVEVPQIISGFDEKSLSVCRQIFGTISKQKPVTLLPLEAELAKLFCNAWRYINFAISNQFFQISEKAGANFFKIYEAVKKDYPRMNDFARAGFASGPCLFKDTMQLSAYSQNTFFLGHSAMLINEGMPSFAIDLLKNRMGGSITGKKIAILGMAFKANNDDVRDSLAFKLRKMLEFFGAEVICHDPYVKHQEKFDFKFVDLPTALKADAAIIGAPHKDYKKVKVPKDFILIDIWGMFNSVS